LTAGEKKVLGDPRTRRFQAYGSIADVFQLYSTLLSSPEWEKFRFVSRWHELTPAERTARYNEMACHELNFFLYHHDRQFFDRVIAPLLTHKLDKQLVDLWLLAQPLDSYLPLWRTQRLNTLERILVASRIETQRAGTERWMREVLEARPLSPTERQQRFEIALRGSALAAGSDPNNAQLGLFFAGESETQSLAGRTQEGGYGGSNAPMPHNRLNELRRSRGRADKAASRANSADADRAMDLKDEFFGVDRKQRGLQEQRLFQTLDQTREWAESQYYHVRLSNQSANLLPTNSFWQEFMQAGGQPFLPRNLDLPCGSVNEALCALAVIDLPLARGAWQVAVEDDQLAIQSQSPAIVFLESIEPTAAQTASTSVLVGQDIYVAQPSTDSHANLPVSTKELLSGVAYRVNVVVTNPTSRAQRVDVLTQLPAGSVPLSGSKLTHSTALDLQPYSTAQTETFFYFPAAADFEHYGTQVSSAGQHLTAIAASQYHVADEPTSVDQTSWSYLADWGTNVQVLDYLRQANLQRLDLARIAFRLQDADFYRAVTSLLSELGHFDASLWAYAVVHNDRDGLTQLLHNRADFVARLGVRFDSPLIRIEPQQQLSYEHLDYRPLVVARTHQLGREAVILNPSLHRQYAALLDVIAHQANVSNDQCLQLCYYMLLQNRIAEALQWFARVDVEPLSIRLQYDYFDAYLEFYRGDHSRAHQIASRYVDFPVPRWAELYARVRQEVELHQKLQEGNSSQSDANALVSEPTVSADADQRILADRRAAQQATLAAVGPALDLELRDGVASAHYRNLEQLVVNCYLMDIELLFSRNPFASQGTAQVPAIRPNFTHSIQLAGGEGVSAIELPEQLRNRNVLLEVTAAGISRSMWLTASSLGLSLAEPMGRVQVHSRTGRTPVSGAYVKVFARHRDGSIRFFKDGYTDLNGNFDYATLSTSDLETAERLAILVLDEQLGAVVKEASPPTR
jgi:hypothetical protein